MAPQVQWRTLATHSRASCRESFPTLAERQRRSYVSVRRAAADAFFEQRELQGEILRVLSGEIGIDGISRLDPGP
jgi:hypothetical protein